jgi:hypothetical protein
VARGQARLFGAAGSNPPGSVSTLLSDSNVSVYLIHAYGVITPAYILFSFPADTKKARSESFPTKYQKEKRSHKETGVPGSNKQKRQA